MCLYIIIFHILQTQGLQPNGWHIFPKKSSLNLYIYFIHCEEWKRVLLWFKNYIYYMSITWTIRNEHNTFPIGEYDSTVKVVLVTVSHNLRGAIFLSMPKHHSTALKTGSHTLLFLSLRIYNIAKPPFSLSHFSLSVCLRDTSTFLGKWGLIHSFSFWNKTFFILYFSIGK